MEKKLNLKVNQSDSFADFLKRFSSIDNALLLEFSKDTLKAKTHTPERSVVKSSEISLDDIFSEHNIEEDFKVGIFNIDTLQKSFKYFAGSDFTFQIKLEKNQNDWVGTQIVIFNNSLDISFACATLSLFSYISDTIMEKITSTEDYKASFLLQKQQQTKINSLFSIDADYSKLTFEIKNKKVYAKGKNFKLELLDTNDDDTSLSVFKMHYLFLDNETCEIYIMDDKLVLKSSESETKLIIGESS